MLLPCLGALFVSFLFFKKGYDFSKTSEQLKKSEQSENSQKFEKSQHGNNFKKASFKFILLFISTVFIVLSIIKLDAFEFSDNLFQFDFYLVLSTITFILFFANPSLFVFPKQIIKAYKKISLVPKAFLLIFGFCFLFLLIAILSKQLGLFSELFSQTLLVPFLFIPVFGILFYPFLFLFFVFFGIIFFIEGLKLVIYGNSIKSSAKDAVSIFVESESVYLENVEKEDGKNGQKESIYTYKNGRTNLLLSLYFVLFPLFFLLFFLLASYLVGNPSFSEILNTLSLGKNEMFYLIVILFPLFYFSIFGIFSYLILKPGLSNNEKTYYKILSIILILSCVFYLIYFLTTKSEKMFKYGAFIFPFLLYLFCVGLFAMNYTGRKSGGIILTVFLLILLTFISPIYQFASNFNKSFNHFNFKYDMDTGRDFTVFIGTIADSAMIFLIILGFVLTFIYGIYLLLKYIKSISVCKKAKTEVENL